MSANLSAQPVKPWYREPWPWYLMAGPAIVIVAASVTAWLAVSTSDGLVTDDYYKRGLVVDQTIARSKEADKLGLMVRAKFSAEGVDLGLEVASGQTFVLPKSLTLTLSHPTRAGLDQTVSLALADGRYVGKVRLPASGHWLVLVEDDAQSWRLMGNVVLPALGETVIGGATTGKSS